MEDFLLVLVQLVESPEFTFDFGDCSVHLGPQGMEAVIAVGLAVGASLPQLLTVNCYLVHEFDVVVMQNSLDIVALLSQLGLTGNFDDFDCPNTDEHDHHDCNHAVDHLVIFVLADASTVGHYGLILDIVWTNCS